MARLNVEDELDSDPRFQDLIALLGDAEKALGKLVRFWKVAQRFWGQEMAPVPVQNFREKEWRVLVEVGLAEERPEGFYAKGAERHFEWYLQTCRKSRKGGEARKIRAEEAPGNPGGIPGEAPRKPSLLSSLSSKEREIPSVSPPDSPSARGPKPSRASPFDLVLAAKWAEFAKEQAPHLKIRVPDYAEAIRKLRELDGFTEDQLDAVFVFVRKDDFWRPNALSPVGLRGKSKSNGLRKIDNVLTAMKRGESENYFAAAEAWARQGDPEPPKPEPRPVVEAPPEKTPEQLEEERKRRAEQLAQMRQLRLTKGGIGA